MQRNRWAIAAISSLWLVLLVGAVGCGRSQTGGLQDGGGTDRGPDGPPPCQPSCSKACDLLSTCGASMSRSMCMNLCSFSSVTPATIACLKAQACDPSPSCTAVRQCVTNPQVPDLTVSSFRTYSTSPGRLTYSVRVCNYGTGATNQSVRVHFYRNRTSRPPAGVRGDRIITTSPLSRGACRTISTSESGLAGGLYRSYVQVDADRAIVETNESNNVRGPYSTSVQGGGGNGADLTVTLTATLGSATSGNLRQVRYTVRTCNYGTAASTSSTRVEIYYNRSSRPSSGSTGNRSLYVPVLSRGACRSTTTTTYLAPGTYRSYAYVDRRNDVPERNESNNVTGPRTVYVPGGTGPADLRVSGLAARPQANGYMLYTVTTCNYGRGTATGVRTAIYYNRFSPPTLNSPPSRTVYVGTINAGQCITRNTTVALQPGTYRSWAYVDYQNRVPELDESNNVLGPVPLTVSGSLPDLYISSFTTSAPSPNGLTYYRVRVCNTGGPLIGTARLGIYYNRASAPPIGASPDRTSTFTLSSGGCTTRTVSAPLSGGTYRSWAFVDYRNLIKETNESNNRRGPLTVIVGNGQPPDLRVASFNAQVSFNGYVYYYVTVCNQGQSYAANSTMGLYTNLPSAPTPSTTPTLSMSLPGLNAGACSTRSTSRLLSGGTHTSWVYVDRTQRVPESNENNNVGGPVKVVVQGGGQADLRVINFIGYQNGSYVLYQATVCNYGKGTALTSRVGIYYNRATAPKVGDQPNRSIYVSNLVPGACTTRSTSATLSGGTYTSWALADYQNLIPEIDENNNVAGPTKVSVGGGLQADLQIASLTASAAPNGYVYYNALVCNQGQGISGSTNAYLWYNLPTAPKQGQTGANTSRGVSSLQPGQCRALTITAQPPAGNLVSWLYVDPLNRVPETNESNNTRAVKVSVAGGSRPDLQVLSFSASQSSPGSSSVRYDALVCNRGSATSNSTALGIYYNRSTAPSPGISPSRALSVGSLFVGQCRSVSGTVSLPAGTYRSWALVDYSNIVAESNETNNTRAAPTFTVGSTTNQCSLICKTLVSPCNLLPPDQVGSCESFCNGRPQSQRDCAYKAAVSQQCSSVIQCLFGP